MPRRRRKNQEGSAFYSVLRFSYIFVLAVSIASLLSPLLYSLLPSWFSNVFWFVDLASHFPMQISILAMIIAAIHMFHKKLLAGLISLALAVGLLFSMQPLPIIKSEDVASAAAENITVLQFNVFLRNNNAEEIVEWLGNQSATTDVIALFEVNEKWQDAAERLGNLYPYSFKADLRGGREVLILSRLPASSLELLEFDTEKTTRMVKMLALSPVHHLPVSFYFSHSATPIFPWGAAERNSFFARAVEEIKQDPIEYKIWVGDMNNTVFSPIFKNMLKQLNMNQTFNLPLPESTWPAFLSPCCGIAIDHVFVTPNINVKTKILGPSLGSDHLPVITTLNLLVTQALANSSFKEEADASF